MEQAVIREVHCSQCGWTKQKFFPEENGEKWKECLGCGKRTMIKGIVQVDEKFRIRLIPTIYGHALYVPQYHYGERNFESWNDIRNVWSSGIYYMNFQEEAIQVVEAFRPGMASKEWGEWCRTHPEPFMP